MVGCNTNNEKGRRYINISQHLVFIEKLEIPLVVILTFASGYYTYRGALSLNTDITVMGTEWGLRWQALVISASVSAVLFVLLTAFVRVFPELDSWRLHFLGWPLLLLIAITTLGISAYFNLAGMIGTNALLDEMQEKLDSFTAAVDGVALRVKSNRTYTEKLGDLAKAYQAQARTELLTGDLSGHTGRGPVEHTLSEIADIFSASATRAESQQKEVEAIADGLKAKIKKMSEARLTYEVAGVGERQKVFYENAEQVRNDIYQVVGYDPLSSLESALDVVQREETAVQNENNRLDKGEKAGLDVVYRQLKEKKNQYIDIQGGPPAGDKVGISRGEIIGKLGISLTIPSVYTATWERKWHYIPFVIAAILLDTAVIPFMLIKMLARRQMRADGANLSVLERVSAAELQAIKGALREGREPLEEGDHATQRDHDQQHDAGNNDTTAGPKSPSVV